MKRHAVPRLSLSIQLLVLLGLSLVRLPLKRKTGTALVKRDCCARQPLAQTRSDLRMQTTSGWLLVPAEVRVD